MKYNIDLLLLQSKEEFEFEFFYGGVLSQWKSCAFVENDITFNCTEQYMMYKKAMLFGDYKTANNILMLDDPRFIKSLGRKVKNFDESVWDVHKYDIVKKGNLLKFSQNKELHDYLISTDDKILVEASKFDTIWGIGLPEYSENIKDITSWKGTNLLGFALMEVRDCLKGILE